MRLDKFLWFVRLTQTRSAAQDLIEQGHIRLNKRRITRTSCPVSIGDVLVIPCSPDVLVTEIMILPHRRGPAKEAQSCYRVLDGQAVNPIAGTEQPVAEGSLLP